MFGEWKGPMGANPVLAESYRAGQLESFHRGRVAVFHKGKLLWRCGDIDAPIFPRSSIKIFQALPLVESGAAARWGFDEPALALAAASHIGSARHVELASRMLSACGLGADALRCGPQPPADRDARKHLLLRGDDPSPLHNGCSGKHAAMLAVCQHLDLPLSGYCDWDHPLQIMIRERLEAYTDAPHRVHGLDGCSLPTYQVPMRALGLGFSRAVEAYRGDGEAALRTILSASLKHPALTQGSGHYCTGLMEALAGRVYVKSGAEAVYVGLIFEKSLAVLVKIDDGTLRAAEVVLARVLAQLLSDEPSASAPLASVSRQKLRNFAGHEIGSLEAARCLSDCALP